MRLLCAGGAADTPGCSGASKDVVVFHQITIPALTRADPPVKVSSIKQGLVEAFQPERMDGDNCYECAARESYDCAVRQERLTNLPPQLQSAIEA